MRDEAAAAAAAGQGFLTDLQRMVLNAAVEERNSTTAPATSAAPPAAAPPSASAPASAAPATGAAPHVPAKSAPAHHASAPSVPVKGGSKGEGHTNRSREAALAAAKAEAAAAKAPPPLGNKQERKSHTGLNGRPKKGMMASKCQVNVNHEA